MSIKQPTTLLEALELKYPESSKNTLKKWIRAQRVFVDGELVDEFNKKIAIDADVSLGKKKEFCRYDLQILHEDEDLVVIYKPEGLLSVASNNEFFHTAHDFLKRRSPGKRVFPVHRLDRDTSGVMIFAYHPPAKEFLKKQFQSHTIYREYQAVVLGHLEEKKGRWESYLIEDENYKMHECEKKEGSIHAITDYEVIAESKKLSLVRFILKTGKKNQIRVQAAYRGHPLFGDKKYGESYSLGLRLHLHAYALDFEHPSKKKRVKFTYPVPKEFTRLFSKKGNSPYNENE